MISQDQGVDEFLQHINVSRETLDKLKAYAQLLVQWQGKINLVGPSTLPFIWRRHFLDSAQLILCPGLNAKDPRVILDIGSGAGFPGLILGLLTPHHVHLVESDQRKSSFLRAAVRTLDLRSQITIHNERLEDLEPFKADIITARAFAPLSKILQMGSKFAHMETIWLLLKGQDVDQELTDAAISMNMLSNRYPSLTNTQGVILELRGGDQ